MPGDHRSLNNLSIALDGVAFASKIRHEHDRLSIHAVQSRTYPYAMEHSRQPLTAHHDK